MYDIHITAASIDELADQIANLHNRLRLTPPNHVAQSAAPSEAQAAAQAAAQQQAGLRQAVDPVAKEERKPVKAVKPKVAEEPKAEALKTLDFNVDVAPVVIKAVEQHGKPLIVGVLEQFGAAKASEVDPARWPELVTAIYDAIEQAQ
jgi:hypothetical protein